MDRVQEHPGGGQVARSGGQKPVAVGDLSGDAVGYRGAARTEVCHRRSQGNDQHVHVEQGLDLRTAQNKHSLQRKQQAQGELVSV
ncbi:hypothetical protein ABZ341_33630 [Streptomyces sp. NPDC006173]|uniref:hypothetical protein n=1 Tax=Streptomyces sp. NPDC006173 TaxID=3155349 RepID=UPI0033CB3977